MGVRTVDEVVLRLTKGEAEMVFRALYVLSAMMADRQIPVKVTRTQAARRDVSYARKKVAVALNIVVS